MFGKPGKAGKQTRPEQAPPGASGPQSGGNMIPAAGVQAGRQPIPASYAARLGIMTALTSPAVSGRFRPQDQGAPTNRGTGDFGALQSFKGLVGRLGKARVGAQGGPSSQPGYPGTNNVVLVALGQMDQPGLQKFGGLG